MSPAKRAYICWCCLLKSGRQSFSRNLRTTCNSSSPAKSPSPQSIVFDAEIQPSPHHLQKSQADTREGKKPTVSGPRQRQPQDAARSDSHIRKAGRGDLILEASETGRLRRLDGLLKKVSATATASKSSTNLPVGEAVKQSLGTLYLEERAILMRLVQAYGDRDLTGFGNEIHRISRVGSKRPLKEKNLKKLVKDIQGAEFFGINATYKGEPVAKAAAILTVAGDDLENTADAPEKSHSHRRKRVRRVQSGSSGVQGRAVSHHSGISVELPKPRRVLSSRNHRLALERVRVRKASRIELLKPRRVLSSRNHRLALERGRVRKASRSGNAENTNADIAQKSKVAVVPRDPFSKLEQDELQTVKAQDLVISPVDESVLPVPGLAHDLSRVLFNPGVYQLQDPRSRVFNFDPYLQHIMPVTEFDFDALKDYITSSNDGTLSTIASHRGRKYIGSSSSMTGMLVHFHFLLSHWREINTNTLSRGFPEKLTSFTTIQRAPTAIFLKWKDGHYAIDADKEYDSANILMSLGRSMEKLLTLEKDDFERYRRSNQTEFSKEERSAPESYHYSEMGKFLMRSQLDAHDPRLPGTGMFDLKTRAVVSIRMNTSRHEEGLGYQIRHRFGGWESYEREFFDMIRSAFLKYSLQVRMGRMDGIFVAFHNVERIFGFQYVSLPELDLHLHGQSDTTLGDQEFKISLAILEEVFERATKKYPEQSLRFHFETRNTVIPVMYIFAEPVGEEDIRAIQDSKKDEIAQIETRIFGMAEPQTASPESEVETGSKISAVPSLPFFSSSTTYPHVASLDSIGESLEKSMKPLAASAADDTNPDSVSETMSETKEVLGMVLTIRNKVNGQVVLRPSDLKASDKWTVDYTLADMDRPGRAWELYSACKQRRKVELSRPNEEQDTAANYYLRKIKDITQEGAKWRKEQDELDRGKEAVVLYGAGRGTRAQ